MKTRRTGFCLGLILILLFVLLGCSSGSNTPVVPAEPISAEAAETSHHTWGLWQFMANPEAGTLDVVQLRTGNLHLNALPFLEPPPLVNLTLESVEFNGNIIDVDIGLRHPFLGLNEFTGFDVCGILISNGSVSGFDDPDLRMAGDGDVRLLNPDGYSRWWNPAEFPVNNGTIMGYTDGLLGEPDSHADYNSTLNAYRYFCDDLGPGNPLTEVTLASRGMFSAGQKNIRHYAIEIGDDGLIFNYAVDASWKFPDGSPPYQAPDDFPPGANRPEAWRADVTETKNTLWNDGLGGLGGDLSLSIDVYDWYNPEMNTVTVESQGNFNAVTSSVPTGSGDGYSTYEIHITNAGPGEDSIVLLISVGCEKTGYGGLLPGKTVTAYFTNAVSVGTGPLEVIGWPCFLHDPQHTGVADCVLDPATLELKWTFPTGDWIWSSPVIAFGIAYFGSNDAVVYAVDLLSGTEVWNTPVDSEVSGTAAIGIDAIYIGTEGGYMYALDRTDGTELWYYQVTETSMLGEASLILNSAILVNERVYFTANNGKVYCINALDGSEIFNSPTYLPGNGNSLHTVPAYYEEMDQIVVTADSFDVIGYDASDGTELWRSYCDDFISCSPTIDDGCVYFTDGECTRKYDMSVADPPAVLWTCELLNPDPFMVFSSGALTEDYYFSLSLLGGKVCAHRRDNGLVEWKAPDDFVQGFASSPAVSGDTIYCATTEGILYGFDIATGNEVFNYDLSAAEYIDGSSVAIAEDRLLIGCSNGNMYCFGPT